MLLCKELQDNRGAPLASWSQGPTSSNKEGGGWRQRARTQTRTHMVVTPPSTVRAQRRSRRHVRGTIALDSALEDAGRIIWQSCSGITVRFFQCRGHSQTVPRSARGGSNAARGADLTSSSSSSGKDRAPWRHQDTDLESSLKSKRCRCLPRDLTLSLFAGSRARAPGSLSCCERSGKASINCSICF